MGAASAVLRALGRAVRRDLGTFRSLQFNNFFLFVALLMYGALESGLRPRSAYPFLFVLALLMLFPMSADPLAKIPPVRLALWPLARRARMLLRIAALAYSPVLWIAGAALLLTAPDLALVFLGAAVISRLAAFAAPRWSPLSRVPAFAGRIGALARISLRQAVTILDFYLAALISIGGTIYRVVAGRDADPAAFPILAILVALALSTWAQCLFGLDTAAGVARYRIMPLRGRDILLAKDSVLLGIALLLTAPLSPAVGLTFTFTALAIGHVASVLPPVPQLRWRFCAGRVFWGTVQAIVATALSFGMAQSSVLFGFATVVLWASSLYLCGQLWDRRTLL